MSIEVDNAASTIDALLPPAMALRAEEIGVRKVAMPFARLLALAILAGAFIALGATFATTAAAGAGGSPWGPARVLVGVAFSLGLILVLVGGAELFTGNNLIVMAWASGRVRTRALLRNWAIVFAGNAVGAISANHGHTAVITSAQLASPTSITLDIQGSASHSHIVALSQTEVGQIANGARVSKVSSNEQSHNHTVTFN